MSPAVHQNFVDLAKRLIDKNGRPVQVRAETQTPTDPAKPWGATTDTFVFADTSGVFIRDASADLILALRALGVGGQGSSALTGVSGDTNIVLIPAKGLDFTPEMKHKLIDGDKVWAITEITKTQPGPTVIMYVLTLGN